MDGFIVLLVEALVAIAGTSVFCYWMWYRLKWSTRDDLAVTDIRPLGDLERRFIAEHKVNTPTITAACFVSFTKVLSANVIEKALHLLVDRHELLKSCIKLSDSPCFVEVKDFALPLTILKTNTWQDVFDKQIMKRFEICKEPLWSVCVLPNISDGVQHTSDGVQHTSDGVQHTSDVVQHTSDGSQNSGLSGGDVERSDGSPVSYPYKTCFIFNFHHVITDGCSRIRLLDSFLTYLDQILKGQHIQIQPQMLYPAYEYYLWPDIKPSFILLLCLTVSKHASSIPLVHKCLLKLFGKQNMYSAKFGLEESRNPKVERNTRGIPLKFAKQDSLRFLAECKARRVTVQAAVQTIALISFSKLMNGKEHFTNLDLNTLCTVNLRPFIKGTTVSDDAMGAYFCSLRMTQNIRAWDGNKEEFWQMVLEATTILKSSLRNKEMISGIKNRSGFANYLGLSKDGCSLSAIEFTNLGNCSFLDRGDGCCVKLDALYSGTSEHSGSSIFYNNVITFNSTVFWTVLYFTHITNTERAREFSELIGATWNSLMG